MIRKFFGNGDVFIYVTSDTVLQGEEFKKGEQIAYFANVPLALEYTIDHKESSARDRKLSYIERSPQALNIGGVPNTKELERIFFGKIETVDTSYSIVDTFKNTQDNTLYLKRNQSPLKVRMFSKEG